MMARLRAPCCGPLAATAAAGPAPAAKVIGVDDFAWRRSHSYGGIFVDLERSTVIAMPPDRQRDTIMAWLKENPQVRIICRDRGPGYGAAAAEAPPQARQVADRWHLRERLRGLPRHGSVRTAPAAQGGLA